MFISDLFKSKKTVWSFEIFPPKPTADLSGIKATVAALADLKPDYVSVTCSAGGSGNSRTNEIADMLLDDYGILPLAHLTCINSTKDEIRASLKQLHGDGVENILALRGDVQGAAPSPDFAHADELVRFIRSEGYDFDIAGACYPEGHPESRDLIEDINNLKRKVDAGVTHLNTQLFYDNDDFFRFRDMLAVAGIDVPVQAGIMPLVKKTTVDRTVGLTGAKIPAKISRMVARFYDDPDSLMQAGIAYATDQIVDLISAGVDGVHLYVMNNAAVARAITAGEVKISTRARKKRSTRRATCASPPPVPRTPRRSSTMTATASSARAFRRAARTSAATFRGARRSSCSR